MAPPVVYTARKESLAPSTTPLSPQKAYEPPRALKPFHFRNPAHLKYSLLLGSPWEAKYQTRVSKNQYKIGDSTDECS